jgi:hypothetical protein
VAAPEGGHAGPSSEPPGARGLSVPPAARPQPGRLVSVGTRSARQSEGRRQAHSLVDRILGLPLVPRDGEGVVRERRHRQADERGLRVNQGRPRRAA